jgi:hypothetical protein
MTLMTGYDMLAIEPSPVMPGLVPGIHAFLVEKTRRGWPEQVRP